MERYGKGKTGEEVPEGDGNFKGKGKASNKTGEEVPEGDGFKGKGKGKASKGKGHGKNFDKGKRTGDPAQPEYHGRGSRETPARHRREASRNMLESNKMVQTLTEENCNLKEQVTNLKEQVTKLESELAATKEATKEAAKAEEIHELQFQLKSQNLAHEQGLQKMREAQTAQLQSTIKKHSENAAALMHHYEQQISKLKHQLSQEKDSFSSRLAENDQTWKKLLLEKDGKVAELSGLNVGLKARRVVKVSV